MKNHNFLMYQRDNATTFQTLEVMMITYVYRFIFVKKHIQINTSEHISTV